MVKRALITVTVKLWKSKKRNSVKEIRSERVKRKLLKKRKRNFILHGQQARKRKLKIKFISLKERKLHLILTQNKIDTRKYDSKLTLTDLTPFPSGHSCPKNNQSNSVMICRIVIQFRPFWVRRLNQYRHTIRNSVAKRIATHILTKMMMNQFILLINHQLLLFVNAVKLFSERDEVVKLK